MSSEGAGVPFSINGKVFTFRGVYESRERNFFQLYLKVLKGAPCNPEDAIACFRENLPESNFTDEELKQLLVKHERRREERDAKKRTKLAASPTGGQMDDQMRASIEQCDSEPLNDAARGDSEVSKSRTSLRTATETDRDAQGMPSPQGTVSAPILRTSGGWAAEPKQVELTAWERELLRRRERAQGERESSIGEESVPPPPQRSNSPSLPSSDITEKRARTRNPSQSAETESQDMAAITRKSGTATRISKERKSRKADDRESMQKMMAELLDKTNNIQGRIAQLESTTSSALQNAPTTVSSTQGARRGSHTNTPTIQNSGTPTFSSLLPVEEDILRLVRCDNRGRTLLHEASLAGRADEVQELLASGADADVKDASGRTPLMLASMSGLLPIVHLLSSKGVSVNEKDNSGYSSLLLASKGGHIACLQYLHLRGADLGAVDVYGRSALHHAVGPTADTLKATLELSHTTSSVSHSASVDFFGSSRVPQSGRGTLHIDQRDLISSGTPLHYAAAGGHTACVEELLSAGAQLLTEYNGLGPLALSAMSGNTESTQVIIGHMSASHGWGPIHEAAISGVNLQSAIQTSKDVEASLNQGDAVGQAPLLLATMVGNSTAVEYLISKGADVNLRDQLGRTALHHAAVKGNLVLCKTLVRAGASIDVEDAFRYTALHLAILSGFKTVVDFLSGQGADHLLHRELSTMRELVARQAPSRSDLVVRAFRSDLYQPDSDSQLSLTQEINSEGRTADQHGRTALHIAAFIGDDATVAHLLSLSLNQSVTGPHCSIHATDNRGWTALHYCAARDTIRCTSEPLTDLSAVPLTPNQSKNVTLTMSAKKNERQLAVVRLLLQANGGFGSGVGGSHNKASSTQDIRKHRAHDGRRAVDLAMDEGNVPEIVDLLRPPETDTSWFDSYWGYQLSRWFLVMTASITWGLLGLTCCILYLLFIGESVSSLLTQPLLLLFDKASWLRRKLSLWYNNDTDYDYDRSKSRTRRAILFILVVFCSIIFILAPLMIVVSHQSNTYDAVDLNANVEPPQDDLPSSKYELSMLASDPTERRQLPSIERNGTDSGSSSATTTLLGGIDYEWDTPRESSIPTDGKKSRDVGVAVLCSIILLITLVVARRVLVDARDGHVAARAVSRKINFSKKGNWAMLFCAIFDPLVVAAVPFTILDDNDNDGFLPLAMRSLLLDTVHPLVSAILAALLMLFWISFSGLSTFTSAITSSESLTKRIGIIDNSSLHCVSPAIIHFLSHSLYLPIVLATMRLFHCEYTAEKVSLEYSSGVECYTGMHALLLVICVSLLVGFVTTSCTIGVLMCQPRGGATDVYWGPALLTAEKLVLTATAGTVTLGRDVEPLCHMVFFFLSACLLIYAGRVDDKVPSMATIVQWRMLGYTFIEVSLATCAFVFKEDEDVVGTLIFLISFVIALLAGVFLYRFNSTRMVSAERESAFRRLAAVHVLNSNNTPPENVKDINESAPVELKSYSFMEMHQMDQPPSPKPPLPGGTHFDGNADNGSSLDQKPNPSTGQTDGPTEDWIFVNLNEAQPSATSSAV